MFTGIISHLGQVVSASRPSPSQDMRFVVQTTMKLDDVTLGASIACSGACMTVIEKGADWFAVDVSDESLACTLMATWQPGHVLNLERALRLGEELGGHIVTGHVDGLAEIVRITEIAGSHQVTCQVPDALKRYIAAKGSITLDGISLTVNQVEDRQLTVNIIPHTWASTTLHTRKVGSKLHCEVDILARYVLRGQDV